MSVRVDHKDYIKQQYKLAQLDFMLAHTEEAKWDARKTMAKLEALAAEIYGFDFADNLVGGRKK